MNGPRRPTVAHCVTPYLFLTGSWIHSQLVHSRRYRPVVLTQAAENLDVFPFSPVHDLSAGSSIGRLASKASKYLRGRFPSGPYLRTLREEGVSLLHAHQGWEGARLSHLGPASGLPVIVSFYGRDATLLPKNPYWRWLYRGLFSRADRIIAEGHFMAGTLEKIGAPRDRIRVVHLGVDPNTFTFRERTLPEGNEPIVGLIAASFREKKGIRYALEALALLEDGHPRLRLRIIGDGPLRGEIEGQIAATGIGDRVELLGYQPYPVFREELGRAHFLLAPSVVSSDGDSEGGAPVCLLDAQASGLPIVASTHCDIPEVTIPDRSALLAPERDVRALADRIDELLSHPERWPEMGRAGRGHVESEFDISRQVERMADVYDEVL
ncbi:MAG: glycosyltransferase [Candidatus Eisenbacteria bacterium]|nr:glycosyltransferase [Candidatus Eisenbacteria bacterium]